MKKGRAENALVSLVRELLEDANAPVLRRDRLRTGLQQALKLARQDDNIIRQLACRPPIIIRWDAAPAKLGFKPN